MQPRWLFIMAALASVTPMESAIPDPVTEQDNEDCEQALQLLKADKDLCEQQIVEAQTAVSEEITGYKKYLTDVENQMKLLEPDIKRLENELSDGYERESELSKEVAKESKNIYVGAFLHRQETRTQEGCNSLCISPMCQPGDPANGGVPLVGGYCTKYASKFYGMYQYCGEGANYEHGDYVRCTGCLEDALLDQYMKCDDDRKIAQEQLDGCRVKAETVEMWNTQRVTQYKEKADVYIMRVSRQADPLMAKITESARVSETVARKEQELQDVKDNLPMELTTTTTTAQPALE